MKTLFTFLILFKVQAWSNTETLNAGMPKRNLKSLYQNLNDPGQVNKVESEALILRDYHLLVSSATWWQGSSQAESMWENLAQERARELNIVVVYDSPRQDVLKIKSKSAATKMYEHFDQNRKFYYWFSHKTLMDAVLIGPDGKVLFQGLLNSAEKVNELKTLIKKKEVY